MKNKRLAIKIRRFIFIRWRAFRRRPLLFLRYIFATIFFRLLGIIVCVFLTVVPLPLNHLVQNLFNLNLSLNSFQDIMGSVKKMALNLNHMMPSVNDILNMSRQFLVNISTINPINIIRDLPSDLRQFFGQLFCRIQERLRDLKIFCRGMWPPRQCVAKVRMFVRFHAKMIRRLVRSLLMMLTSLICVKFVLIMIIPLLGLSAIKVLGIDVTLVIVGVLTLISSQLGALLGRGINSWLIKLYHYLQQQGPVYQKNVFIVLFFILYAKLRQGLIFLRFYLTTGKKPPPRRIAGPYRRYDQQA